MHTPDLIFPLEAGTAPVVAIAAGLEVLCSVRLGDDPRLCVALWDLLARHSRPHVPYVLDDRRDLGTPRPATEQDHHEIRGALESACNGPQRERTIDWSTVVFQDTGHVDEIPLYTVSCSIGWIKKPTDGRGISLRLTFPSSCDWASLLRLSQEVASRWPELFRWIGVGYRFVPVSMHSTFFEASAEVIRRRSKRFLAVDIGDPFSFYSSVWQDRLRTPLWITILSPTLVTQLGGTQHVRSRCSHPLHCEVVGDGLLLQAGDQPTIGDVNRRHDLLPYRMLDDLLKPVLVAGGVLLLPPWDEDATARWLARFHRSQRWL